MEQRRGEKRVPIVLPVRILGIDADDKPFQLNVHTLDITSLGVRLEGVQRLLKSGDTIVVQYEKEKARYKVIWTGKPGTATEGQVGLFCAEPQKKIWGAALGQLKETFDWSDVKHDRVRPTVPPPPTAPAIPAEQITKRLQAAITELRELEKLIATGAVEPRILAEFREAINHVRQTAWVVEQWLELVEYHKDAYSALSLLGVERVRCLTQLTLELIRDVDGGDVTYETDKILELAEATYTLSQRLAGIVGKGMEG